MSNGIYLMGPGDLWDRQHDEREELADPESTEETYECGPPKRTEPKEEP